ncbi:MAG TPA: histidine phosphatase family protein [Solirubrobacteraceae bacterium]|jgi:phosphohistidine phosphatase|nr:histidine phosphatase family protein [Solirubrobacteraceae bacterium]
MARQLWLLRHAEAEPHGSREDAARRLTERGEQQARVAGVAIAQLGADFDAVLFSPKVRAAQTAMLAAEAWEEPQRALLAEHAPLAAGFDAHQALDAMAGFGGECRVMLVGHEPDLSQLAGALAGARLDLKKGGLAILRLDGAGGELAVLMRPRELALIAGVPVGGH